MPRRRRPNRAPSSYRSNDPDRRANQLANLRVGGGNRGWVEHGAYGRIAAPQLETKTRLIFEALASDLPVQENGSLPAADAPAVRLLADALCRLDGIGTYLNERGWRDDDGLPRPVLEYEARLRAHALDLLKELGMTPASRAKLGLDLAKLQSPAEKLGAHLERYQ